VADPWNCSTPDIDLDVFSKWRGVRGNSRVSGRSGRIISHEVSRKFEAIVLLFHLDTDVFSDQCSYTD
jgi:hypothetical protein